MDKADFNEQANVLWHPKIPLSGQIEGGETRHFDNLKDAIQFVMNEIPNDVRGTAWITKDSGALTIEQIADLYEKLPD